MKQHLRIPFTILVLAVHFESTNSFLLGHQTTPQVPTLDRGEEGQYRYAAVGTPTDQCSQVGVHIMAKHGGSAVDAAIASALCIGVTRFQSSGIGGGNFMTIYDKASGKVHTVLSRCSAPLASNSTMFVNRSSLDLQEGGLSIAVPGEISGFWEAHKLFGRLPWKALFQPSIQLADFGFTALPATVSAIQEKVQIGLFDKFPELKTYVTNPDTNTWYKVGELIKLPKLARTLSAIADGGAWEFYNGTMADTMVKEIQDAGGIITKKDFETYYSVIEEPLHLKMHNQQTIYAPTLPSSGPVLLYMLNILSGYNMTSDDLSTNDKTVLTYHRFLETFKHGYAMRSRLGDPEVIGNLKELFANLTSPEEGEAIRRLISDSQTFPWQSYNPAYQFSEDGGTSQLSLIAPNGDAVSMTSTINLFFGSKVVGETTGILYNDLMDDFSTPGVTNSFGIAPSPSNYIKPGNRPMSSMAPAIVIDDVTGRPVFVIGCAGGPRITTTITFLTGMTLWLGEDIKSAIDAPRIHHQLMPDVAYLEENAPQWLVNGLRHKGHNVTLGFSSVPVGILQRVPEYILANADGGIVDGY